MRWADELMEQAMFTLGAIALTLLIAWFAQRKSEQDRTMYDTTSDDGIRLLLLHVRQDLKLIAFLLGAVVAMLGVIADRVH